MSVDDRTEPRGTFIVANILLLMVAALHTMGSLRAPEAAADISLVNILQSRHMPVGLGWTPSMFDIVRTLALTMTINLVGIALVNFGLLPFTRSTPGLLRRLSLINTVVVGAIVVLSFAYRIAPPFLTLGIVDVVFLTGWRAKTEIGPPPLPERADPPATARIQAS